MKKFLIIPIILILFAAYIDFLHTCKEIDDTLTNLINKQKIESYTKSMHTSIKTQK